MIKKINNIMNILNSIEYGFKDKNGINLINNDEVWDNFSSFYYLLTPEELLKTKCGVCWDQVELERELFNKENINNETYFIYIDDKKYLPSHTFLTYELDNKYYWFEHSWDNVKGIHEYNDKTKMLEDIKEKFIESKNDEVPINCDIHLYKYNKPNYHINCDEFYQYIKTQEKINI